MRHKRHGLDRSQCLESHRSNNHNHHSLFSKGIRHRHHHQAMRHNRQGSYSSLDHDLSDKQSKRSSSISPVSLALAQRQASFSMTIIECRARGGRSANIECWASTSFCNALLRLSTSDSHPGFSTNFIPTCVLIGNSQTQNCPRESDTTECRLKDLIEKLVANVTLQSMLLY